MLSLGVKTYNSRIMANFQCEIVENDVVKQRRVFVNLYIASFITVVPKVIPVNRSEPMCDIYLFYTFSTLLKSIFNCKYRVFYGKLYNLFLK